MTTATVNVRTLKENIARLVKAAIADSWKGGGDPEDIPFIEFDLKNANAILLKQLQIGARASSAHEEALRLLRGVESNRHLCFIPNDAPGLYNFDERLLNTLLKERA